MLEGNDLVPSMFLRRDWVSNQLAIQRQQAQRTRFTRHTALSRATYYIIALTGNHFQW